MVHSTRVSIELDIFLGLDFLPLFKFPAAHSCLMRGIFRSFFHCLHLKIAKIVCLKWIAQKRPPLYEARNISGTKYLFHGTKAIFSDKQQYICLKDAPISPPASFEWKILRFVFTRHFLSMSEVLVNGHQDIWVQLETATRRCPGCMASTILSNWLDFRFQSKVGLFCTFGYLQLSIYLLTYMGVKTPI